MQNEIGQTKVNYDQSLPLEVRKTITDFGSRWVNLQHII